MPGVSGNVFNLDAQAGFDEGVVRGSVGASARMTYNAHATLCHGLDVGANAQIQADAQARLGVLWVVAGNAEGQGTAAAGVSIEANLPVDLFQSFGFSANASAYAEASLAGKLGVGLDLQDIAALARGVLSDVAYDIFIDFLEEVTIEAGVWGKVSFAAMASAYLTINGSLADDTNSGFMVAMGAEAGFGGGGGNDFYAGMQFQSAKQFYLRASERITRALVSEARALLPVSLAPVAPYLELLTPALLNAAFELGQAVIADPGADPSGPLAALTSTFTAQLQRFVLDQLSRAGTTMLSNFIDDMTAQVTSGLLDAAARQALRPIVQAIITDLDGDDPTLQQLVDLLPQIVDVAMALSPDQAPSWRAPLTIAWCAAAAAEGLRAAVGSVVGASSSASMVGLGASSGTTAAAITLGAPPAAVTDELTSFFGTAPGSLDFQHAVQYLVGRGIVPLIAEALPDLAMLLDEVSHALGVTAGDVVSAAIAGTTGGNLAQTELYTRLRNFAKAAVDRELTGALLPALRAQTAPASDTRAWIDEVASPSLGLISNVIFARLDTVASGGGSVTDLDDLRTGASLLVAKIVVRNVVVLTDILGVHVIASTSDGLAALGTAVRADPTHELVIAAQQLIPSLIPLLDPTLAHIVDATRVLVADLCDAASAASGPTVWTPGRVTQFRGVEAQLLTSVDAALDPSNAAGSVAEIKECAFIPDTNGISDLFVLLVQTLADGVEVLIPLVGDALGRFFAAVIEPSVADLEQLVQTFDSEVAAAVNQAWSALQGLVTEVGRLFQELQTAIQQAADRLADVAAFLSDPARRSDIENAVKAAGEADATATAETAPGFSAWPGFAQQGAIDGAVGVFDGAFTIAKPAMDLGLQAVATVADDLATLLTAAADAPSFVDGIATAVQNAVTTAINDALGQFGVSLPGSLGVDDIASIAHDVIAGLPGLSDAAQKAIDAQTAQNTAQGNYDGANASLVAGQQAWQVQNARQQALAGHHTTIDIVSPAPVIAPRTTHPWTYTDGVSVLIRVTGATAGWLEAGSPSRILLGVNGQPLTVNPGQWTFDDIRSALVFTGTLDVASGTLQRGLNALDCSVSDGVNPVIRERVVFAVNPALAADAVVEVEPTQSVFDSRGDDNRNTAAEQVTLKNVSADPLALGGWGLFDRARHHYTFPGINVPPGATLSVHTGAGTNTDTDLYWGLHHAIWNNTGDVVYIIDPAGTVRAELAY